MPALRPPPEAPVDADRSVLHRRHRAHALAREIAVYGEAQGLVLRNIYREPDPQAFVLAWLWLWQREDPRLADFLEHSFREYWAERFDPASLEQAEEMLGVAAKSAQGFRAWAAGEGDALRRDVAEGLRERGIFAVPGYFVEGEYFSGRQHLPMIRFVLEGRQGRGPI